MKILLILLLVTTNMWAQDSLNVKLLFNWNDTSIAQVGGYGNAVFRYNEVWGVAINGREYAIIGSTAGTHIFDVTDPFNSIQVEYIPGADSLVVHRDYHDYNGYLYMVCDEGNSTLQIADLTFLPDSAPIVYDSDALFARTHNIFIDSLSGLLYTTYRGIYSLANPINPLGISSAAIQGHDLYARNDTLYVNQHNSGLYIYDYTNPVSPTILGSLTSYPGSGYNHSGWLNETGNIYAFADETYGSDIKICDVSDFSDIKVLAQVNSGGDTTAMPHNLIIENDLLYVSYYHDGLYIYDISDPSSPNLAGYYDTYLPSPAPNYNGAWGVYPLLPSGIVLVSDTEYGLFVFDVADITSGDGKEIQEDIDFQIFPNPFKDAFQISYKSEPNVDVKLELFDLHGNRIQKILETKNKNAKATNFQLSINCEEFSAGIYFLNMSIGEKMVTRKLIKIE